MSITLPASQTQDLTTLAGVVRAGLAAVGRSLSDALAHGLDVGDALLAAKKLCGHGHWLRWLDEACGLSARTAAAYMRLATHREILEVQISNGVANLSLRGALRLVGTGRTRRNPRTPSTLNPAAWKAASRAERMAFVEDVPLIEWLEVIPTSWRTEIIDRVDGLRAVLAKPVTTAVVPH
jgi:hypothetical protein